MIFAMTVGFLQAIRHAALGWNAELPAESSGNRRNVKESFLLFRGETISINYQSLGVWGHPYDLS